MHVDLEAMRSRRPVAAKQDLIGTVLTIIPMPMPAAAATEVVITIRAMRQRSTFPPHRNPSNRDKGRARARGSYPGVSGQNIPKDTTRPAIYRRTRNRGIFQLRRRIRFPPEDPRYVLIRKMSGNIPHPPHLLGLDPIMVMAIALVIM